MENQLVVYPIPHVAINVAKNYIRRKVRICKPHIHNELEMLYVIKGCILCHMEDEDYYINEGHVMFINSRVPHWTETVVDYSEAVMLQFLNPSHLSSSVQYLVRYLMPLDVSCRLFTTDDENTKHLCEHVNNMYECYEKKDYAYEHFMIANMYEIMAQLYKLRLLPDETSVLNNAKIKQILPIIEMIDREYNKNFSLSDIAKELHLNESYVCRMFKKATGGTVMDYMNFVRVCKAEKLLKAGKTVAETSESTGFSSQSYFNKVFKKYNCCSPSQFKELSNSTHTKN